MISTYNLVRRKLLIIFHFILVDQSQSHILLITIQARYSWWTSAPPDGGLHDIDIYQKNFRQSDLFWIYNTGDLDIVEICVAYFGVTREKDVLCVGWLIGLLHGMRVEVSLHLRGFRGFRGFRSSLECELCSINTIKYELH